MAFVFVVPKTKKEEQVITKEITSIKKIPVTVVKHLGGRQAGQPAPQSQASAPAPQPAPSAQAPQPTQKPAAKLAQPVKIEELRVTSAYRTGNTYNIDVLALIRNNTDKAARIMLRPLALAKPRGDTEWFYPGGTITATPVIQRGARLAGRNGSIYTIEIPPKTEAQIIEDLSWNPPPGDYEKILLGIDVLQYINGVPEHLAAAKHEFSYEATGATESMTPVPSNKPGFNIPPGSLPRSEDLVVEIDNLSPEGFDLALYNGQRGHDAAAQITLSVDRDIGELPGWKKYTVSQCGATYYQYVKVVPPIPMGIPCCRTYRAHISFGKKLPDGEYELLVDLMTPDVITYVNGEKRVERGERTEAGITFSIENGKLSVHQVVNLGKVPATPPPKTRPPSQPSPASPATTKTSAATKTKPRPAPKPVTGQTPKPAAASAPAATLGETSPQPGTIVRKKRGATELYIE